MDPDPDFPDQIQFLGRSGSGLRKKNTDPDPGKNPGTETLVNTPSYKKQGGDCYQGRAQDLGGPRIIMRGGGGRVLLFSQAPPVCNIRRISTGVLFSQTSYYLFFLILLFFTLLGMRGPAMN